jgi:hypothetical protein
MSIQPLLPLPADACATRMDRHPSRRDLERGLLLGSRSSGAGAGVGDCRPYADLTNLSRVAGAILGKVGLGGRNCLS